MKRLNLICTLAFCFLVGFAMAQPGDIPNTEPGKCYAKCLIPDQWETVTEEVLVKPASKRTEIVPASYDKVTERVLVKAESKKIIPVAAEYETVTETILVRAESKKLISVPAEYEMVEQQYVKKEASTKIDRVAARYETTRERIEITPASTKWVKKRGDKNCLSADPNDCITWCLVEEPAQHKFVDKRVRVGCPDAYTDNGDDCTKVIDIPVEYAVRKERVVKTPATYREEIIPAEYKEVNKRVVKTPATFREEVIDAEHKDITRTVLRTPAVVNEFDVPAEYTKVTKRVLVKPGGFSEWREVLCSAAITTDQIAQIQRALISRGYDVGPAGVDNIFGTDTKAALMKFQEAEGLPVGNLNLETLKALGVKK